MIKTGQQIKKKLGKIISLAWQDANGEIVRLAQSALSLIAEMEREEYTFKIKIPPLINNKCSFLLCPFAHSIEYLPNQRKRSCNMDWMKDEKPCYPCPRYEGGKP